MQRTLLHSIQLLGFLVLICCVIYPLSLLLIGQTLFSFQANGSIVNGPNGQPVGSLLIAQAFSRDEFFQPRPSAAAYDASASSSSALAASNYALRDRVARALGPIVKYASGPKAGQLVGPDIVAWFKQDNFAGKPHIAAQWAALHPAISQAWVNADAAHKNTIAHPEQFSVADTQALFFDMWRTDNPDVALQDVPGDMVTTSGSGLDPHIGLQNALYQLDRVAGKWAAISKRDVNAVRGEIEALVREKASAPLMGLAGEPLVNVLELNLELSQRYA